MAATVATPLERQFSQIPGVDVMTSDSSVGTSRITLQFALERNIDAAAQDVQTAIAQARRRSEEHTSELQSLMRISYAVFCLKKKKQHINTPHTATKTKNNQPLNS